MNGEHILSYRESPIRAAWREFWHLHFLTLNQGRFVKRWHIVLISLVCFGAAMFIIGDKFTAGMLVSRFFDALGDLFLDRGAGEL